MFHADLEVWKTAMNFVEEIYKISRTFPREEVFGLAGQMQRAAVSIPSNIAEGAARQNSREFLRFVRIAQGSLAEVQTQILIAQRVGYKFDSNRLNELASSVGKMLIGLARHLENKANTQ